MMNMNPLMNATAISMMGGIVGQESTSTPNPQASILSFPTIIPGIDLNYIIALSIIGGMGIVLFLCFGSTWILRWIELRNELPTRRDDEGDTLVYRSTTRKLLSWPGIILQKLSLVSFQMKGIPSFGTILLIVLWIGITAFAILFHSLPKFGYLAITYRLP
jgi:hypothetical protein